MLHNPNVNLQQSLEEQLYYLQETAELTFTGFYSSRIDTGEVFVDEIGRSILAIPDSFEVDIRNAIRLFKNKGDAIKKFASCIEGGSFNEDLIMQKFDGTYIWVKGTGKPWLNEMGDVIGVRGVFTSIDRFVKKSEEAEKHARVIKAHNERLVDFAHIVSHNLRSHASNLQLTLETFDDAASLSDLESFKNYLSQISNDLNRSLRHLNVVVTTHVANPTIETINISDFIQQIIAPFETQLMEKKVTLKLNFDEYDTIEYVPDYLESIFKNLISNAVKYSDPTRDPVISITTKHRGGKNLMVIKDNGIGIDLIKNKDKIFKLYKTFHTNEDARGLGLFVVKNQVESQGGDISVKSTLGEGTSFTIRF